MIGQVALKKPSVLLALGVEDGGGNPNFDESYNDIIDYATIQGFTLPSPQNQRVQNSLLSDLKSSGIWDELDVFYNFFTDGDANFAKINWKDPGTFQAVGTGHEPRFVALGGFRGNGTTQYLDTTWAPNNGIKFTQLNASLFAAVVSPVLVGGFSSFIGNISSGIYYENSSNKIRAVVSGGIIASNSLGQGGDQLHFTARTSNTLTTYYRNGVADGTISQAASAISVQKFYLLARNNGAPDIYSA